MKEAVKLQMVCISFNNDRHAVPKTTLVETSLL